LVLTTRDLPWRGTNPYAIWLSEIMLLNKLALLKVLFFFLALAPLFFDLAEANEEEVLNCGRTGYYLVLGIYKTAQYVAWELAGVFQIITVIY
jgi:adenine-specific DNA glycosylase